jgi:hypothetical protein
VPHYRTVNGKSNTKIWCSLVAKTTLGEMPEESTLVFVVPRAPALGLGCQHAAKQRTQKNTPKFLQQSVFSRCVLVFKSSRQNNAALDLH